VLPSAVQMGAEALGIALDDTRGLTVTGASPTRRAGRQLPTHGSHPVHSCGSATAARDWHGHRARLVRHPACTRPVRHDPPPPRRVHRRDTTRRRPPSTPRRRRRRRSRRTRDRTVVTATPGATPATTAAGAPVVHALPIGRHVALALPMTTSLAAMAPPTCGLRGRGPWSSSRRAALPSARALKRLRDRRGRPPCPTNDFRERPGSHRDPDMQPARGRNAINLARPRLSRCLDRSRRRRRVGRRADRGRDKAFSAGMDLKAFARVVPITEKGFGAFTKRDFTKALIAACNGSALAGGCEIMLSLDLVVAADHQIPVSPRSTCLVAGAGGLIRLPSAFPRRSRSSWPSPVSRSMPPGPCRVARQPRRAGDQLMTEALALAGRIAKNPVGRPPRSRSMKQAAELPEDEAGPSTGRRLREIGRSADAMEGAIALCREARANWTASSPRRDSAPLVAGRWPTLAPGLDGFPPDPPRAAVLGCSADVQSR